MSHSANGITGNPNKTHRRGGALASRIRTAFANSSRRINSRRLRFHLPQTARARLSKIVGGKYLKCPRCAELKFRERLKEKGRAASLRGSLIISRQFWSHPEMPTNARDGGLVRRVGVENPKI